MATFTALLDACVLYPAPLRDFFMRLAVTDAFRARWSENIHDEWSRSVLANRPDLTLKQLTHTKELMNSHVRDCLVSGYEELIAGLRLPDSDDRHVLAAAIRCSAAVIVTFNLKDFPEASLARYEIEAQHPDDFVCHLIDLDPAAVRTAFQKQLASLRRPPQTCDELLANLRKVGLPKAMSILMQVYDEI